MYSNDLPPDSSHLHGAPSQSYTLYQSYVPSQLEHMLSESYAPSQRCTLYAPFNMHEGENFDSSAPYYTWSAGSPLHLLQGLGQDTFPSTSKSNQGGDSQVVCIFLRLGLFSSQFLVLLCRCSLNTASTSYTSAASQPPPSGVFTLIPVIEFRNYGGQAAAFFFHIFSNLLGSLATQ